MFESDDFKEKVKKAIARTVGQNGMSSYNASILDEIIRLASSNEQVLMETELKKSAGERKGVSDAIQSINKVIAEASKIAAARKSTNVELSDFRLAFDKHYCTIWPLCKPAG